MGALGLLQTCHEHPGFTSELMPAVDSAIEQLLSADGRAFDAHQWGEDPLESLNGPNGHAAYLGYVNLVLALHRTRVPHPRFAPLNDRITAALMRRFDASRGGQLETYPGEAYPVDNAAGLASLMIHQRATGQDHSRTIAAVLSRFRTVWRDPASGLLFQAVDSRDGQPAGQARASGTALAAFFLSYGEREVSKALFEAVCAQATDSIIGFGLIREYATDTKRGTGDVDSGPLIFGASPSATGFCIGASRAFGNRDRFVRLYRTVHLLGTPVSQGGRLAFVMGGPLGNAILLAMLTASEIPP